MKIKKKRLIQLNIPSAIGVKTRSGCSQVFDPIDIIRFLFCFAHKTNKQTNKKTNKNQPHLPSTRGKKIIIRKLYSMNAFYIFKRKVFPTNVFCVNHYILIYQCRTYTSRTFGTKLRCICMRAAVFA